MIDYTAKQAELQRQVTRVKRIQRDLADLGADASAKDAAALKQSAGVAKKRQAKLEAELTALQRGFRQELSGAKGPGTPRRSASSGSSRRPESTTSTTAGRVGPEEIQVPVSGSQASDLAPPSESLTTRAITPSTSEGPKSTATASEGSVPAERSVVIRTSTEVYQSENDGPLGRRTWRIATPVPRRSAMDVESVIAAATPENGVRLTIS